MITIDACAKINLGLRVKDARADGFHEVQTILQTIDLADRVTCEAKRGPFRLVCTAATSHASDVPADRTNLVWKGAQLLWEAAGRDGQPRDAAVTLEKKIPMRAGLGGGSSDAAAALRALRRVWKMRVADEELQAIASRLGSDVPYFFIGGTALGLGRGEELYALEDLPRWWVVLIFPPFGVSTAEAYEWLDAHRVRTGRVAAEPRYLENSWMGRLIPLVNDLERPVIERHPVIGKLRDRLTALGAELAAMSGSGSTVFGVFTSARVADAAARKLRQSGAKTQVVRFRPRRRT
jgi:4-diphosphocytidyl-2-C-methyl-D-erythritol kinase